MRKVFRALRDAIRREVPAFQYIPWHMGVAYRLWNRDATVCYIMPLNWLVRWSLHLYYFVKAGGTQGTDRMILPERLQKAVYEKGWDRGHSRGYEEGVRDTTANLQSVVDTVLSDFMDRRRKYEGVADGLGGDTTVGQGLTPTGLAPEASGSGSGGE